MALMQLCRGGLEEPAERPQTRKKSGAVLARSVSAKLHNYDCEQCKWSVQLIPREIEDKREVCVPREKHEGESEDKQ
eukprot:4703449-Pleurochrysis_carterae.AAC.2